MFMVGHTVCSRYVDLAKSCANVGTRNRKRDWRCLGSKRPCHCWSVTRSVTNVVSQLKRDSVTDRRVTPETWLRHRQKPCHSWGVTRSPTGESQLKRHSVTDKSRVTAEAWLSHRHMCVRLSESVCHVNYNLLKQSYCTCTRLFAQCESPRYWMFIICSS